MHYPASLASLFAGAGQGSHLCAFYETTDDLIELVLPFFAEGTKRNEFCVWMMPDAVETDARAVARVSAGKYGIELRRGRELYQKGTSFERELVVAFWDGKLEEALSAGRSGMRTSGDAFWLQHKDWDAFLDYERAVNDIVADKPLALLCTYPLSASRDGDIFDVARIHHLALAKRPDGWEVIEAPSRDRLTEMADAASRIASLTVREREVLKGIVEGHLSKAIALGLGISQRTVEAHRTRLLRRLHVRTMAQAVRMAALAALTPRQ